MCLDCGDDDVCIDVPCREIDDHLRYRGLPVSDASDGKSGPRIEILSDHLPSSQLVMFYKSCDAFVLSTHGEGACRREISLSRPGMCVLTDCLWCCAFIVKAGGYLHTKPW